jgi:PAS domain S-box-containing protein
MLIQEGVTLDKLNLVTKRPRDLFDPDVDAFSVYLTNEPFLWSQKNIEATIIRPQSYGIDFYGDVLFGSIDGLRNEQRAERFLEASLKGWQYAFEHPDETISIIHGKYNSQGRSRAHLLYEHDTLRDLVEPALIPIGQQNPYRWERIAQIYHSLGMAPAPDDFSDFIYDPARDRAQRLEQWTTAVIVFMSAVSIAAVMLWLWSKSLQRALVLRTASLNQEIRSHHLTQHDLKRALAKYKTLFSTFPHGITVADDHGNIIEANEASETLLGLAKTDHVARTLDGAEWRIIRPDGSNMPRDERPAVVALRGKRTVADSEMGVCRPDGEVTWLSVTAAPLPVEDCGVVVTYSDITERKMAQDALQRITGMLSRTESIAHIGSWQWEVEQDLVTWSDELFRIFALDPSSPAPSFAEHHGLYSPEDMARLQSAVERALTQAEPYELDLRAIRSDGETRYCRAAGFPEIDSNGKVVRLFGFLQDNTEARELQQALIQAQKMEAIGRLTGGIAHDFNNILGGVLGFAELALHHAGDQDPKLTGYLKQIETAGGRARDLVKQLMIYSRGQRAGEIVTGPLGILVDETIALLRPMLPAIIEIRVNMPSEPLHVAVDVLHLQQILMNLAINARDAMPFGGTLRITARHVSLSGQRSAISAKPIFGEFVELVVADTGYGIAAEQIESVFQPFFTTKEPGKGTGMGLAVVAGLLTTNGGDVLLESERGQGTTFRLLLSPADELMNDASDVESQVVGKQHSRLPACRVLIAEDESFLRDYLLETLTAAGADVVASADGLEALARFLESPGDIDVVLTDIAMPGMDGLTLAGKVREIDNDIPIILCTGNNETATEVVQQQLKIDEVLHKPLSQAELVRAIKHALGHLE